MPGLQVSLAQACRLWGLDPSACEAHLQVLLEEGFLACRRDGGYLRLDLSSPGENKAPDSGAHSISDTEAHRDER
jgi:hypothetical protein